ncbi:kyphoscoliosis peptidase-like isoform X2 [Mya arenaria]|uniref:kyphoscoliosis peptidase-like isoform X2 n=1 Tax=Mya arenaria TaxID=6604 RepID=UPI0022E30AD5|nr:kyphoscoliosis peptidase-like isoform X2 [Mya arenaria]
MFCCGSVDVYVSNPHGEDTENVSGCFLSGFKGGKLTRKVTPKTAPPKEKKKVVVPSPYMFMHIDEHVRKTPENVARNVKSLVTYLVGPCKSDMEKVRAFYYWICNNIGFDRKYNYPKRESPNDPNVVLRHGTAMSSEGYTNLFSALCRSVSIPVKKLKGYVKDTRYDPEEPFTQLDEPEHAWNAVYVGHDWRFVDCAWGSGFEDEEGIYHKRYEEFWFMTDPENFINDHFPYLRNDPLSSDMWQLLKRPVTLEEYNKTVRTEAVTRDWGVEFSHREPIIVFRKELHIIVKTTIVPIMQITATLDTSDKVNMDAYVATFRDSEDHYKILARPPSCGVYILKLAGKREGDTQPRTPGLVKYILKCTDINNLVKTFPFSYTAAQTLQVCVLEPTYRDLEPNSPVKFRIASPFVADVYIEDLLLEKIDDYTWEGEILTPKKSGQFLVVYGTTADASDHRRKQPLYKFNIL